MEKFRPVAENPIPIADIFEKVHEHIIRILFYMTGQMLTVD